MIYEDHNVVAWVEASRGDTCNHAPYLFIYLVFFLFELFWSFSRWPLWQVSEPALFLFPWCMGEAMEKGSGVLIFVSGSVCFDLGGEQWFFVAEIHGPLLGISSVVCGSEFIAWGGRILKLCHVESYPFLSVFRFVLFSMSPCGFGLVRPKFELFLVTQFFSSSWNFVAGTPSPVIVLAILGSHHGQ